MKSSAAFLGIGFSLIISTEQSWASRVVDCTTSVTYTKENRVVDSSVIVSPDKNSYKSFVEGYSFLAKIIPSAKPLIELSISEDKDVEVKGIKVKKTKISKTYGALDRVPLDSFTVEIHNDVDAAGLPEKIVNMTCLVSTQ